ncbi:rhomboid-like protein [Streptomyces albireticuli]|uniref:rhomboid-like protein n=1 Tax=Streptomyces albireticuli TaxID=1940 RepID=UPI00368B944B
MTTRLVRLAPAYVGAVLAGSYATHRLLTPAARERLLRRCSTNADNLDGGRWDTLATSALLTEGPLELPYALLLLAVLGYAEYAYGAWWAATAFVCGHVGASLLVYAGLRAVHAGAPTRSATDVGPSYGYQAVLGALGASLPKSAARNSACAALLAFGVRPLLSGRRPTFTDVGHLTALGLGLVLGPGLGPRPGTGLGAWASRGTRGTRTV